MRALRTLAIAVALVATLTPAKANAPIMEMMAAYTYAEKCLPHDSDEYRHFRAFTVTYYNSLDSGFQGMWSGAVSSWLSMRDACELLGTTYEDVAAHPQRYIGR